MKKILPLLFLVSCTISYPVGYESDYVSEDAGAGSDEYTEEEPEESLCDTTCLTNADCEYLEGICLVVYDSTKIRTICTKRCNADNPCSDSGFQCTPIMRAGGSFQFQCIPVTSPVCGTE